MQQTFAVQEIIFQDCVIYSMRKEHEMELISRGQGDIFGSVMSSVALSKLFIFSVTFPSFLK